jgi:hypothetical protein
MSTTTETQLRQLRAPDRLRYHGVEWQVKDFSTYTDDKGYETEEWLLKSQTSKEYYLMREVDPQNPSGLVHWYLAETVRNPAIYEPESARDLTIGLAAAVRSCRDPYPQLKMHNRLYQFESQTEGDYVSEGETRTRITWDYWDQAHLWNLALEAWSDNQLIVYSTRKVKPEEFTQLSRGTSLAASSRNSFPLIQPPVDRSGEFVMAWVMVIVGFMLMMFGI